MITRVPLSVASSVLVLGRCLCQQPTRWSNADDQNGRTKDGGLWLDAFGSRICMLEVVRPPIRLFFLVRLLHDEIRTGTPRRTRSLNQIPKAPPPTALLPSTESASPRTGTSTTKQTMGVTKVCDTDNLDRTIALCVLCLSVSSMVTAMAGTCWNSLRPALFSVWRS